MTDYHIKQEGIIETLNTNRVTFVKMMKDNSFSDNHKTLLFQKYGGLL